MRAYVYQYLDGVTDNYHSGGGVLVITNRDPIDVLREKANGVDPLEVHQWDAKYVVETDEEAVFIFPNAGCC